MRKLWNVLSAPLFLLIAVSVLSPGSQAQAVMQDRISEPIDHASMSALAGTVHPQAREEFDQGLADNAKVLQGLSINFQRSAAQEASLQALLQAQQDPTSASYHKWLTPAQFGQLFGMSSADLAKVSAWLQQEGFTITSVAQSNNSIGFSGSIAAVERAFQTQIHNYSQDGETHFANATEISIPSALAGTVSGVRGLNDFRLKPKNLQFLKSRSAGGNPHFTSGATGMHYVAPGDFATIYDVNALFTAGFKGTGLTIGVVGQTDIVPGDITDFRAAAGLSVNNPTVVTVPGTTPLSVAAGAASDDLAETDLDLEWSGGVATAASVVLVNSNDVIVSLQYVIQNTIGGITIPIVSQSYGNCEALYPSAELSLIESVLAEANAQGQTVLLASGDTGAADCDNGGTPTAPIISATQGLAVDYPGSSVYVTDLGGSEFMGDGTAQTPQTGAGTYWSANGSSDLLSSAKSYIPEMAWNDTTFAINNGFGLSAGGGGVSLLWPKPSWQAGVPGIPADGKRDVPDISLNASPDHDGYLYCTQVQTVGSGGNFVSSCQATSFRVSDPGQSDDQSLTVAGGTSFAAPTFSGLLAIIEQKLSAAQGLGNINPALYTLASNSTTYASAFHDITTGNNSVPCTSGSPNCPTGSNPVIGYAAAAGYDQATGLGSVDANNLATAFGTVTFMTGTATTLAVSPVSPLAGAQVTLTATVKASSGTTAPVGTVIFNIDGTAHPAVTLTNGVATMTTSFSTGGPHTVVASYSGATNFFVSTSASTTITVVASGVATTTTTLVASPTTVALSGALTLTATVQSPTAGTVAGTVTFAIGSTTVGTAAVIPGANGVGTATLAVASATAALGFSPGTDTIVATYGGDSAYASSSGSATITVTNPGITVTATNMTISSPSPGNSGTSTITLTSTGGYTGTVTVSASASSLVADYEFGSAGAETASVPLSAGGTGTATITVQTISASGNEQKGPAGNFRKTARQIAAAGGTAAGCILLLLIPGIRRRRWPAALVMLVFLGVSAGIGCGGGGGSGGGGASPAGTYTVTITAADSSNTNVTASTTFTVTIQ